MSAPIISDEEAREIGERLERYEKATGKYLKSNGWRVIPAPDIEDLKARGLHVSNEERSRLEVWDFCKVKPEKYAAYIHLINGMPLELRTFAGDILGEITYCFREYRTNTGDRRINFRARMINGLMYSGIYYPDAGDVCFIRKMKEQKGETI